MAQGTLTLFEEFAKNIGDGTHDLDGDTFKIALITTIPTAADATPALGDYTEVSGGGYTGGGQTLTTTWTEAGGTADFKHTGGTITWSQNGTGPTNIKAGIIYNTSSAVTNAAVCFIDFTSDGTTAISLQDGDITWTPEATQNRIFSLS
jgi:hypothetical protein